MELGLDRVSLVADRLQLRHFACPVITVGGTNGKGSCTKTLESIYTEADFKTALYTSPHLLRFNERIRIDNTDVTDQDLLNAFSVVESARENTILSFFEFTTLAALYLFQKANCDVVIVEVGLGGRLDAVNMVESDVAVVTSIALDHTEWLGNDRDAIAYEKASIARANKIFISGDENPPPRLAETVRDKKGILLQINQDYFYRTSDKCFSCWGSDFHYDALPIPHLKAQNVAIAIAALQTLQSQLPVSANKIAEGIRKTVLPARFESISQPLPCILDVAHNPAAAEWLAIQYQQLPHVQRTTAIVGMLADKDMIETVRPLLSVVTTWYVCSLQNETTERASDGRVIAEFLRSEKVRYVEIFSTVSKAMTVMMQSYCQNLCDRALIFGSFYTVAAAKNWL